LIQDINSQNFHKAQIHTIYAGHKFAQFARGTNSHDYTSLTFGNATTDTMQSDYRVDV